jgi:polysaccharide deacetylase family protein (PEP-CTERM system associated)
MVTNVFSVDVEDWYQGLEVVPLEDWGKYADRIWVGLEPLLKLLDRHRVRGTFFILGYLAERHPDAVEAIAAAGHEVGSHGYAHQVVYRQTPEQFRRDLVRSLDVLRALRIDGVRGYRAPFFSITDASRWALEILASEGLAYDSSMFPVLNDRYGVPNGNPLPHWVRTPRGPVFEVPPSTIRFGVNLAFSGGAYLRLLHSRIVMGGITRLNRSGIPCILYIHPWELDPGHPRIPLPRRIAVSHYWNLQSSLQKLDSLLRRFPFGPVREVFAQQLGTPHSAAS